MERFCDKCGTLVSGDGEFCPSCGARLEGAVSSTASGVNLGKPAGYDAMPGSVPTPAPTPAQNTYQGQSSASYGQQPVYPQSYNQNSSAQTEMTVGSWVGTIFLSSLGFIGVILLFVWAFSEGTPTAKRNYSKAMLIWWAIVLGISILFFVGSCICAIALGESLDSSYGGYFAALLR